MKLFLSKLQTGYRFIILIVLLWSVLIFLSFYFNIRSFEEHSIRLATNQAGHYWNKDSAFRKWASRHGGIYVRPDERTPPNPHLAHIPHRDVETKDGVKLTLMNPAYMMRQMAEEFEELYGVKGRITAQVLLDPEGIQNKPDAWELESLQQFDLGEEEITQVTQINGEPFLRMMRPMRMRAGCVLCHGHLGFKEGDIRGGVSVSVPLGPFEHANDSSRNQTFISHVLIWIIGLAVIAYIVITNRRYAESDRKAKEIIIRSQKMDALGKLTGGIAHDYNNMLGVVMGYAELLELSLSGQPKLAKYAHEIHHAGERGAKLTKKLLAFSSKKASEADLLNINFLLQNQKLMLEKTLTPRITLEFDLQENLWPVWLDESDMEDAILNMSINAMHAIEGMGQLIIQTRNQKINQLTAKSLALKPGDYVRLAITDTGCGMDKETCERIFEPFYSTKGDIGTGLGLSQVYAFAQRSGGTIRVYSESGHGTQFTLYFPRYDKRIRDEQLTEDNAITVFSGNESILVVDDESALREFSKEVLVGSGYRVLCAENSDQALELLRNEKVDLLLTDVIMPGMDGYQLATKVKALYPKIKIQLISGFSEGYRGDSVNEELYQQKLQKPVSSSVLLQKVRMLLDERE